MIGRMIVIHFSESVIRWTGRGATMEVSCQIYYYGTSIPAPAARPPGCECNGYFIWNILKCVIFAWTVYFVFCGFVWPNVPIESIFRVPCSSVIDALRCTCSWATFLLEHMLPFCRLHVRVRWLQTRQHHSEIDRSQTAVCRSMHICFWISAWFKLHGRGNG